MFRISRRKILPGLALLLIFSVLMVPGCGLRQAQTGSLSSRIVDADGNAVVNAEVFSIFREQEKVYSGLDGGFYLSELPAGLNNIVILHPDFALEERQIEIRSAETTVLETVRLDRSNAPNRISDIRVIARTESTATIRWLTYREVVCNIDYGLTQGYGQLARETRPSTEHELEITGLQSETLYHFRVQYIDENNISHYSYDYSFKTEPAYVPYPPGAISIQPIRAARTVEMTWGPATATSVTGYNIYRQEKGADWLLLTAQPLAANITSYVDSTAAAGTFARYAVVSVNQYIGESEKIMSSYVFIPGVVNRSVKIAYLDSPVTLNSDLVIAAGTTLEVEAGVEFMIGETDLAASGIDEARVEILVSGRLVMTGTAAMPVRFMPLNGSGRRDHWAGIKILSSDTGVSKLEYVEIAGCSSFGLDIEARRVELAALTLSYCENGLRMQGLRESPDLKKFRFNEITGTAFRVEACRKVSLSDSLFTSVENAVVCQAFDDEDQLIMHNTDIYCSGVGIQGIFGRSSITNILIVSPDSAAINLTDVLHLSENMIDHCTFDSLNGIIVGSGTVTIENNIVVNRNGYGNTGINNVSVLTPDYPFNNVFGFKTSYLGCGGGVGAVSLDPQFIGGNPFNYDLLPASSLNLQDRFGSEMGRYGDSRL